MRDQNVPQPEPGDEILVARVVQRDVAAFTLLYERYVHSVYAMGVYMLGAADAEEVVQEVFLRLWHRADQFDPNRGHFKAWFMATVRHYILDELRERSQHLIVADDINQVLANAKDPLANVEQEVGLREERKTILHALQNLPTEQRHALVLAYFGGLSQAKIARHLGWPLGTVKKRIRLGMQKLRAALTGQKVTGEVENRSTLK